MGIYANPVGCLNGYFPETPGQIAPSIHQPDTAYGDTYNYFDPDSFFSLSAIMYSGLPYLLEQARTVIERTGAFILPSGQLPHHFQGHPSTPTYVALSGATQTGPNLFWTLAAMRYAETSGNRTWFVNYIPTMRHAVSYLTNMIDESGLLYAEGSLMIDVFIRNNYTSDSNAMMVRLLEEFSEAEISVGNNTGGASLKDMASKIVSQMNTLLWHEDHYVTQIDKDTKQMRDFVDYDANLIAIANGVAPTPASISILGRIDGGRCAHDAQHSGSPTFVSEVFYARPSREAAVSCNLPLFLASRCGTGQGIASMEMWATRGQAWLALAISMLLAESASEGLQT